MAGEIILFQKNTRGHFMKFFKAPDAILAFEAHIRWLKLLPFDRAEEV